MKSTFENTRRKCDLDLLENKECYPDITLRIYNELPIQLKDLEMKRFKRGLSLREWLLVWPYYSLQEYTFG